MNFGFGSDTDMDVDVRNVGHVVLPQRKEVTEKKEYASFLGNSPKAQSPVVCIREHSRSVYNFLLTRHRLHVLSSAEHDRSWLGLQQLNNA